MASVDKPAGSDEPGRAGTGGAHFARWLLSVAFLLAVVVGLIVTLVVTRPGQSTTGPPEDPPPPGSSASASPGGQGSTPTATPTPAQTSTQPTDPDACPATRSSNDVPTTTPRGVKWASPFGLPLPSSKKDGPLTIDGPIARCYSHTPTGALLAVSQLLPRMLYDPNPEHREATIKAQMTDGPAREQLLQDSTTGPDGVATWVAFRVLNYTPQQATIMMIAKPEGVSGSYLALPSTAVWEQGDWKMSGTQDGKASTVADISGYIPWKG